jgi:regulator of protease activity HflC (stomatin/prohibitin superfamily)
MTNFFMKDGELLIGRTIGAVALGIFALIFGWCSFTVVPGTHVAVGDRLGTILEEPMYGFEIVSPVTMVHKLDATVQRIERDDSTYTIDQQPTKIAYIFTYRIVKRNAPALYAYSKDSYKEDVIEPRLIAIMKNVIGLYDSKRIVDKRAEVSQKIEAQLKNALGKKALGEEFFTEISFYLKDINYSDEYEAGVSAKMLAEQEALKTKNRTMQIEEEAKQQLIKAEAEAKSIAMTGEALRQNPQYIELQRLDVQKKMAESAAHWQNPVLSSGQSSLLLGLPSGK